MPVDQRLADVERRVLVVDGNAYSPIGFGSDPYYGRQTSLHILVSGRKHADNIGKHLSIRPRLRTHPGYLLAVRFTPKKTSYDVGQDIEVVLQVKNVGEKAVTFQQGGRNRAARDNQYEFIARSRDGKQIRDRGKAGHFGGISHLRTLEPGGVFETSVNSY